MNEPLIVAVDGGNSKTDVLLLRVDGTVLASVRGAGSSPHQLGLGPALQVVDDLIDRAWLAGGLAPRNGDRAAVAAVFMAGADLPSEEIALADAVTAQGWAMQNHVANDVFAVLWAATGTGHGVAVTVGAGVNCVGASPSGRRAWFPALGEITGDWGGGPDIGMAALGAGVRSEDGRGAPTALARAVASYFGFATALEVAVAIHQGSLDAARVVELPPLVVSAAEEGDAEALAIMRPAPSAWPSCTAIEPTPSSPPAASRAVCAASHHLPGSTSVVSGCGAQPLRTSAPVSASRMTTLQDWVDESIPATSVIGSAARARRLRRYPSAQRARSTCSMASWSRWAKP